MWKKLLAAICIPVVFFFTLAMLPGTLTSLGKMGDGTTAYRISYLLGNLLAMTAWGAVMFLWWRWIVRTLRRPPN